MIAEIIVSLAEAIKDTCSQPSVSDLLAQCKTLLVMLHRKLALSIIFVSVAHRGQRTRLFSLCAGRFKNNQTLLEIIQCFPRRDATRVNRAEVTHRNGELHAITRLFSNPYRKMRNSQRFV